MRNLAKTLLLCLGLAWVSVSLAVAPTVPEVKIDEITTGEGEAAVAFSVIDVHYTGRLQSGEVFDSSIERGEPIRFTLGAGQVIPGWELGIRGMKPGGKRKLTIPPELAYGDRGAGGVIPPNATLMFDVELIAVVESPPFASIDNAALQAKREAGTKIIDIRRPEEWAETGVVEGSIKATAFDASGRFLKSFVDKLVKTVKPDEEFIVICRTGNRTAMLSNWLVTRAGYGKVLNHGNGITDWIGAGLPVIK